MSCNAYPGCAQCTPEQIFQCAKCKGVVCGYCCKGGMDYIDGKLTSCGVICVNCRIWPRFEDEEKYGAMCTYPWWHGAHKKALQRFKKDNNY